MPTTRSVVVGRRPGGHVGLHHDGHGLAERRLESGELEAPDEHAHLGGRVEQDRRDAASLVEESFSADLLEYPQYTRPAEFRGAAVPEILLSGNHAAVAAWRQEQARQRTAERRPDLLRDERGGGRSAKG